MKVLLLTQILPFPLDSGPQVKTYYVLRYLAERFDVTLLSFARGEYSAAVEHLQHYCSAVITIPMERTLPQDLWAFTRSLISGEPFVMVRDQRQAMLDALVDLTSRQGFDVVHADQLNMAQYAQRVIGARKVLDAHNALWLLYKRLAESSRLSAKRLIFNRDWKLLMRYEKRMGASFDHVLAVSESDRRALLDAGVPDEKVHVIPISIDTAQVSGIERGRDATHILHIGTMFWPPNSEGVIWFLTEIWPYIQRDNPGVIFDIVGSRPPRNLQLLARQDATVNLTGYLPDPEPYLRKAAVMVVPLRAGGGMRVKILNALAQGIPVVTTGIGCEGIEVEDGRHVLIADGPSDFARATTRVLQDPELAAGLARNGRTLVENQYDYRRTLNRLDLLYNELPVSA
jgi:glycosyltransferase involved in cell wall biosynthesis